LEIPASLAAMLQRPSHAEPLAADEQAFKTWLADGAAAAWSGSTARST
jgi:hypothetical protein